MRLLREPLVHFLAIGAVMFAVYSWTGRGAGDGDGSEDRVVRITAQDVSWLAETWARQRQRPPSDDELRGLVADYVKEELLAHESRELGLADNDTVVRRRLAQKMTFLVQDAAAAVDPGDDELRRFHDEHRERFESPARLWFEQVYFAGEDAGARAAAALDALKQDPSDSAHGDRSLLEREFAGEDRTAISNLFGADFARHVFAAEPGQWHGPISSGYGVHLVRVMRSESPATRDFSEVRGQVLDEWRRLQQQAADERYFAALLDKYEVVVDEGVKPLLGPLGLRGGAQQ